MSEDTQNPLLKTLVVLVILLIGVVGVQSWYLLDVKQQLNNETSQENTLAMQKNQAAIAEVAQNREPADTGASQAASAATNTSVYKSDAATKADKPSSNNGADNSAAKQPDTSPAQDKQPTGADRMYAQNDYNNPPGSNPPTRIPGLQQPGYQAPAPRPWQQWPPNRPYRLPRWPDPYTDDFFSSPYNAQTWDPYAEIQRMQHEMDRIFNESFRRFDNSPAFQHLFREGLISPELDVREDDDNYIVQVNLPGSDESSVNVKLEGQQLTIEGRQDYAQEDKDKMGNIIFRERRSGAFKRSFTLPEPVDEKGMKTDINNGVLTIIIPKLKDPV